MSNLRWSTGWVVVAAAVWVAGCGREAPPEIEEYVPPPLAKAAPATQKAETEEVAAAPAEETPAVSMPAPEAPPPVATRVEVAVAPATPAAAPAGAKGPTIVGTWRVVEMSRNGQSQPMPPGMTMQLTFGEDGTFAVTMPGMPDDQAQRGTYTLNGDQLSISARGEAKTGTLHFEGNDRATFEIDEGKMVLERS